MCVISGLGGCHSRLLTLGKTCLGLSDLRNHNATLGLEVAYLLAERSVLRRFLRKSGLLICELTALDKDDGLGREDFQLLHGKLVLGIDAGELFLCDFLLEVTDHLGSSKGRYWRSGRFRKTKDGECRGAVFVVGLQERVDNEGVIKRGEADDWGS